MAPDIAERLSEIESDILLVLSALILILTRAKFDKAGMVEDLQTVANGLAARHAAVSVEADGSPITGGG